MEFIINQGGDHYYLKIKYGIFSQKKFIEHSAKCLLQIANGIILNKRNSRTLACIENCL